VVEFTTAMAVLDEGVHLAGQQVDAGHQGDRPMALVLVIATYRRMGAGHRATVGSDRLGRPASEKRQGTKSQEVGHRRCPAVA
jgi:hypothetical protein